MNCCRRKDRSHPQDFPVLQGPPTRATSHSDDSGSDDDTWHTAFESEDEETAHTAAAAEDAEELGEFRGCDFSRGEPRRKVDHLLRALHEAREAASEGNPEVRQDPMLYPIERIRESLLVARYLIAEEHDLARAECRLRATVEWRTKFKMSQFHTLQGQGTRMLQAPGAEIYFVDADFVDREGRPTMVGRLRMCNAHALHPYNHVVAAVFVCEKLAAAAVAPKHDASYILDIGELDFRGTFSATGGADVEQVGPNLAESGACRDPPEGREFLVEQYGELHPGLPVLRCAMDLLNRHYPELMNKMIFLNSGWMFRGMFAIFSLWVSENTRKKFEFLDPEDLKKYFETDQLPVEFGGNGAALNGDSFIARAVQRYDVVANTNR